MPLQIKLPKKKRFCAPGARCRIYSLTNPINGKIFYVGKTDKSLAERLTGHVHSKGTIKMRPVLERIRSKGLKPVITELEVCHPNAHTYRRESFWIVKLWNEGHRLCNINLMY